MKNASLSPKTEAELWLRILHPEGKLTPQAARAILELSFPQPDFDRMHALSAKARAGTLTPVEDAQMDDYERVGALFFHTQIKGPTDAETICSRCVTCSMDKFITHLVWERAGHVCEYCRMPQRFDELPFEIDHVVGEQHGGKSVPSNLALACFADNRHKGPNLAGIDPKTGRGTWLFNPRRHKWERHFRRHGPLIVGRTAVGRATIVVLGMNLPHRVRHRAQLIAEGVLPVAR